MHLIEKRIQIVVEKNLNNDLIFKYKDIQLRKKI